MKPPQNALVTLRALTAGILLGAVEPGLAQATQMLYSTPTNAARDTYTGGIGCKFQVGASNVIVSHLGFFDQNNDGLAVSHQAGLFDAGGSTLLGQVTVPAGTDAYLTNGFRWMPLDPPLLLASNTTYIVAAMVGNGDGDAWQDAFTPAWNPFFVGNTGTSTRHAMYGPGNAAWPPASFSQNGNNNTYGNVTLGYLEVGPARVGVAQTNVSISAGQTLSVLGFASGQQPVTYQWYLSPHTPLPNQTNASLIIADAATGDSGTYFLTASNALGSEQSADVTVLVTSFPVGITQEPTNLTVFANYPAAFSLVASGSPPVFFQWLRDGTVLPVATNASYSFTADLTNNGDIYSCLASNYTSLTPYIATSSDATLTVLPNLALPQQFLHGARANTATNNFSGLVGGQFAVGNSPVLVTHLGYYASQFIDPSNAVLTADHRVGIFSANGSALYGYVTVSAGTHSVVNGYMWAPLDPPLVLSNNTQYLLVAEVFSDTDPWGDTYGVPDLNPYFATACDATYWGAAWPNAGAAGGYSGQMYSAPNLAILALPTPSAFFQPTNVTQYAGLGVSLTATVAGQAPVTLQWYKDNIPLSDQTNLVLVLTNVTTGDSGDYYVMVTNTVSGASAASTSATVTVVPDTGPSIVQDIQSQDVFAYSTVQFAAGASGTPPLSYQWTFDGGAITGGTNSTLTLSDVSAANVGDYQLTVTNNYGSATTSVATLTVEVPTAGTYPAAVMGPDLLLYYRFSDANSGLGVATNQGSLGLAYNGTYEGGYSGVAGPTGFSNFEPDNLAVLLDGYSADVLVPSLANVVLTNATIAAWVEDGGGQPDNSAIFFHRSTAVFGLANGVTTNGAEWLKYTWNGNFYNNDTGLILPTNQWTFAAMVINPTNAAIYLQDGTSMKSTNFAGTYPPAPLSGDSYVGWDTAGGATGRRWTGAIDEVMVFDQALSPSAINALYQGVPATVTLAIEPSGNQLVLKWSSGTLLEAPSVNGPWTTNSAARSPYSLTPTGAMRFYRVLAQ